MANRATRCVAHHHDSASERAIADDAALAIVLASVFDLDRDTREDKSGVFEVEPTIRKRLLSLGRVVSDAHDVIVST